jgi:hypothetical protein
MNYGIKVTRHERGIAAADYRHCSPYKRDYPEMIQWAVNCLNRARLCTENKGIYFEHIRELFHEMLQ